jgi:hypothetical protein
MKQVQLNQYESMLLKPNQVIENEVEINYELNNRISQLKILMRVYKTKNKIIYKSLQREYLEIVR